MGGCSNIANESAYSAFESICVGVREDVDVERTSNYLKDWLVVDK